jgi:thioredoxin reductase
MQEVDTMTNDRMTRSTDRHHSRHPVTDVVVIGGGAAGLSAALTLARARREVLVVDAGAPRNAPAAGVHGFLSRDGMPPLELLRAGRAEVESVGGRVLAGVATGVRIVTGDARARFAVAVDAGGGTIEVLTRRLVVATGLTDELPPVPGVAERWGRDVVHCPYCHGWEIRDRAIGVLARTAASHHQALMFRQWSDDVTLFLHEGVDLTDDQREELAARDITVVAGRVTGLRIDDDRLTGVTIESGGTIPIEALAVAAPVRSNAEVLAGLGILPVPHPTGFGTLVPSDSLTGATEVPGVWVAGNVGDPMAQVVSAAASGVRAGAGVNADLIAEETAAAVAARRASASTTPGGTAARRSGRAEVRS